MSSYEVTNKQTGEKNIHCALTPSFALEQAVACGENPDPQSVRMLSKKEEEIFFAKLNWLETGSV